MTLLNILWQDCAPLAYDVSALFLHPTTQWALTVIKANRVRNPPADPVFRILLNVLWDSGDVINVCSFWRFCYFAHSKRARSCVPAAAEEATASSGKRAEEMAVSYE